MANGSDLKENNLCKVRACFLSRKQASANTIGRETGLSHGAVVNALKILEEEGEILLAEKAGTSVGRKTHLYTLNAAYRSAGFILIGRDETSRCIRFQTYVSDLGGNIMETGTYDGDGYDLSLLPEVTDTLVKTHPEISMILVSSPGVCTDGIIRNHDYFSCDVKALIEPYGLAWTVENDVNTACTGFGSLYPQANDMALIYQADRSIFGCGMIINGMLYRGFENAAGELRYFPFMRYAEDKSAKELLEEQILSVAALMNPHIIGWCSACVDEEISLAGRMPAAVMPEIIRMNDFNELQKLGLTAMFRNQYAERRGETI